MDQTLTQLGIGGILALLILKEVFTFLRAVKDKKNCKSGQNELCYKCFDLIKKIYDMHNQKDSDGVYIWYVRRSLEEAMNKLAENIEKQTHIFEQLVFRLEQRGSTT